LPLGLVLLAVLWLGATAAQAALPGDFQGERIGAGHGLRAEIVTSVYQDRVGLLWVGTREGLFLYDGYSARVFDHDIADPESLSDNTIRTIYEDREDRLWLGTNTGGLNRLDRATGRFQVFRHDSADPHSISHDSVYAILEDREGQLWVGTQSGLNRFDPATGKFERLMADAADPTKPGHDYIHTLHEDRAGLLWVGTVGGGLEARDPRTGRFTRYRHDATDARSISDDSVFALAEDRDGDLWAGTGVGLNRFVPATGTFMRYGLAPTGPAALSAPLVTSLAPGPPGLLYVGTWRGGVNEFEIRSGTLRTPRDFVGETDRDIDRIANLHAGREGTIWACTWGAGLRRIRPAAAPRFTVERGQSDDALAPLDVTSVLESRDGTLWVGSWTGLSRGDPGAAGVHQVVASSAAILSIGQSADGAVWFGTPVALQRLDPVSGARFSLVHDPRDAHSLGPGFVTAILEGQSGLWVGTGEGGLHRLREDRRSFERFKHDPADPGSLSDNYVTTLLEDDHGTLWVGTRSGGLNACDTGTARCVRYIPDASNDRSLSHHFVTGILCDRRGMLWVGTGGGGLNRLDPTARERGFERFTERQGLADDNVMGLAEDDDGSLWIGTRGGLTRLDPQTGRVANYGLGDGLPALEFNPRAAAAGRSALYFGTPKGLVSVRRNTSFPPLDITPTVITAVDTLAGPVVGAPWSLRSLDLPHGTALSLEFSVLDFDEEQRHRYAYRLAGPRDGWIDLGTRRNITFADLAPGTYELSVRGRNGRGVESTTAFPLRLRIIPPFWMSWWFKLTGLAGLVLTTVAGHRLRVSALKRRNRELTTLQHKLEHSKEDERKRIARELHDEMGQIMAAAKINLQVAAGTADEGTRRKIDDTVQLVNRMIGQVRAISLDLRPPLLDEIGLGPALGGYLEELARRSGMAIDTDLDTGPPGSRLPGEIEIQVFRLVQESMTNAIRHSGATRVAVAVRRKAGALEITVRDDGRGFEVGPVLERAARGQHLGLLGMRERVRSLGGTLRIDSAPGSGTLIGARLPLGRASEDRT
jgi:signal transduction histidine kinase/ligand-binding sensor domain-containing protein